MGMSRQQAINIISQMIKDEEGFLSDNTVEAHKMAIKALEQEPIDENLHREREQAYMQGYEDASKRFRQEPCEDCISRKSIKQKLQEHHDFFVNAYGGFSNLPLNDKSRVDEISNCIAEVVNEPSVTPIKPKGHWTEEFNDLEGEVRFTCSSCGKYQLFGTDFCYNCGSDNREVGK